MTRRDPGNAGFRRRRTGAGVGVAALLAVALAVPACDAVGVLALATRPKTPAQHTLDPVPTLILVDDAGLRLRDPSIATFLANAIAADLRANDALFGAGLIEQADLAALQADFGGRFDALAIDEIGQRLGAQQVIYVEVLDAQLERAPGVYSPRATAGVKVVDAVARQRVFPAVEAVEGVATGGPGRVVAARLPTHTPDLTDRTYPAEAMRTLSRALASRVAELFYKHRGPEPGSTLPG